MTTSETVETPQDAAETVEHTHDHAGHDHEHHNHHGPVLNPDLTRTISVEAPVEDVNKAFQQVTKRYTKLARIPGFRAGKVPSTLIKSRFARELRQEVLESLVSEKFRNALREQNIQPVSEPQLSELTLAEGMPLKFTATFEVLPTFEIEGYDKVSVEKPDTALSNDDFEAELNNVLDHHATVEPVEEDRALSDGDWAEIGFKGQLQEMATVIGEEQAPKPENEITGEDVLIEVGGKNTLEAFNGALRGAKVGQELSFEATYHPLSLATHAWRVRPSPTT